MNQLRLEINIGTKKEPNWQVAYLEDDASIEIEVNSPLWNDADTYSYAFDLPFEPNRHILGTSDKMFGRSIYKALYNKQFRLWISGVLFLRGTINLDSEVDLDGGTISISLISGNKMLDDMLEGVNAQDVEIFWGCLDEGKDYDGADATDTPNLTDIEENYPGKVESGSIKNVQIGWTYVGEAAQAVVTVGTRWSYRGDGTSRGSTVSRNISIDIPQMMWPWMGMGAKTDFVNYGEIYQPGENRYKHPYCNVPLCTQKYYKDGDEWKTARKYLTDILGQDRLNTSPCFFVLFWLEQLFDIYLNVQYDLSPLTKYDDLLGLCFVNAKCKFNIIDEETWIGENNEIVYFNFDWVYTSGDTSFSLGRATNNVSGETQIKVQPGYVWGKFQDDSIHFHYDGSMFDGDYKRDYDSYDEFPSLRIAGSGLEIKKAEFRKAYATAENFPDEDASNILEALENAFGFKFLYDENSNAITVCYYKDILATQESTTLDIVVSDIYKKENDTQGFRLKYGNSSAATVNNLTDKEEFVSGSDDTTYNYNDYQRVKPIQGTIESGGTKGRDYTAMIHNDLGKYDMSFYVSAKTGNGYRVKVSDDATSEDELKPSLFEVGGFRDVEYGNCEDDDFVDVKEIGFTPIIPNDCNYEQEKKVMSDSEASSPSYRLFVDKECHEDEQQSQITISKFLTYRWYVNSFQHLGMSLWQYNGNMIPAITDYSSFITDSTTDEGEDELKTKMPFDSYELQINYGFNLPMGCDDSDENENIFNSVDEGFMLGILRSSPHTTEVQYYDKDYDGLGQGHYKAYKPAATDGTITADSVDTFGNIFARNNDVDNTLSLKLKAEKPVRGIYNTPDERPYRKASYNKSTGRWPEYDLAAVNERILFGLDGDAYAPSGSKGHYVVDYEHGNPLYYQVSEDACKNRGLFDKFWTEYAYFVTHRKIAVMTIPKGGIPLSVLLTLDIKKKYRIGDYVGWINRYSYTVDSDGVGDITLEFYYI